MDGVAPIPLPHAGHTGLRVAAAKPAGYGTTSRKAFAVAVT